MGIAGHWPIFVLILLAILVFGGTGKLSGLMGDAAKGIKAFKDGLKDETPTPPKTDGEAAPLPRTEPEKDTVKR